MFDSELELVDYSLPLLVKQFGKDVSYIQEPKGLFGIPDVILFNGKLIAIEYKLKNWKQAMKQAYRYQSFSYETYVVLDKKYIDMFKKFNIGLGAVEKNSSIEFYYKPKKKRPFNMSLSQKATELFL